MNCPLCIDQTLTITHHGGIEVDICPQCRGIWLDRGEIDRLAADTAPPPTRTRSTPAPGPAVDDRGARSTDRDEYDHDRDRRPSKKRKKKSLAERLGDVLEEALDL